jgi:uncharacterized membrane protein
MMATATGRLWPQLLLWLVLPPLAVGYQAAAEATARALVSIALGPAWFLRAATLTSVRWLLALELASFVAWMVVLDEMKLSQAFPASALSYVLVILLSGLAYHEPLGPMQFVGAGLILTGIWLISRDGARP